VSVFVGRHNKELTYSLTYHIAPKSVKLLLKHLLIINLNECPPALSAHHMEGYSTLS